MTINAEPTGVTAAISTAVKATLLALIATGALPWTDAQVTAVGIAVTAVVDLALIFGVLRPRVTPVANPKTNDGTPLVPLTRNFD
jgi:hypothetical protein